tara:strand:- start:265 stop:459 length:195 start_codon:yes stop_codon:yes gene_type:complete
MIYHSDLHRIRDYWVDQCLLPHARIDKRKLMEFLVWGTHRDDMPAALIRAQADMLIMIGEEMTW